MSKCNSVDCRLNTFLFLSRYIFMPRFARDLSEDGKELLSMNEVLHYLYKSYKPLVDAADLNFIHEMKEEVCRVNEYKWFWHQ